MNFKTGLYSVIFILLFFIFANAQASDDSARKPDNPKVNESASAAEVERLKSEMGKLQSVVELQKQALIDMQKRLESLEQSARATATRAATPQTTPASPTNQVTAQAGETKSQSVTSTPQANTNKPQERAPLTAGWDRNHAIIRSADGSFETNFSGYAQLDYRGYESGTHPPNSFFIRRARLSLEGKLQRYYDFKIEGDFADTANTILRDAFVRVHRLDEVQFTFGQFRVPISQEEIRPDNTQDFIERSLVNNLVPSRSPGLGVSGIIHKGVFEYQAGAFNGKGLLAANNTGTPEVALRLRFNPLKNSHSFWGKGFLFGGAFTQGRNLNGQSVRGQTESRSITFFAPEIVSGKYIRANGEMTWLLGPAAIRAEYVQTNQARESLGVGGINLPGVVAKGYMAQATYLLTREEKAEAATVAPKHELFSSENGRYGLGAWELKFRYANLQINDGTSRSNRADTIFFGANWYLNRFIRYLLDLGFERYRDPLRSPKPGDKNYFVTLSRFQFVF
jgi:phosphate-selective porin OprO/OprP